MEYYFSTQFTKALVNTILYDSDSAYWDLLQVGCIFTAHPYRKCILDYKNYSPIGVACNSTQRETVLICVLCTGAA